jgi:23S rRNA (cytidine1920-2'-O)/16S rRNA (cytidine1409-2'-O)-methyltransferase
LAERLDIELVVRSLARSRSHAAQLITESRVLVSGRLATKSSMKVEPETEISLTAGQDYVSRAGRKLSDAIDAFGIEISGDCLDAGASTGGFTQVLLQRGATSVVAVDVGHDQLAAELLADPRVINVENQNLRELDPEKLKSLIGFEPKFSWFVADLSFISLTLVIDNLKKLAPAAQGILLVKPQFEVGKHSLNASGIVTDWRDRHRALVQVTDAVSDLGYEISAAMRSSILGTHGNTEYLMWINPTGIDNRQQWSQELIALAKRDK